MNMIFMLMNLMFFIILMSVIVNCFSLLKMLICIEFMVFLLFLIISFNYLGENSWELLSFLVFGVIESVMGLVLMTLKVFYEGSDLMLVDVN